MMNNNSKVVGFSSSVPGKLNEDRFYLFNQNNDGSKVDNNHNYFAYGVFDGHGGSFGSILLSEQFCQNVIDFVQSKIEKIRSVAPETPIKYDILDAVVCDAILNVSKLLSREIKLRSITGTTCVATFIIFFPEGGCRVYCSNTGDSRCVAYKQVPGVGYTTMALSEDHSLELPREVARVKQRDRSEWHPLPCQIKSSSSAAARRKYPDAERNTCAVELVRCLKVEDEQGLRAVLQSMIRTGQAVDMLSRVESLPSLHNSGKDEDSFQQIETDSAHLDDTIHFASDMSQNVSSLPTTSLKNVATAVTIASGEEIDLEVEDSEFITAPIVHNKSFIGRRATRGGQEGPPALFSRHNISITMTRSLGDRSAARCCVCTPEVSVINVARGEFVRLVLASDGLWDVIKTHQVIAPIRKIVDTQEAAKELASYARHLRENARIRIDDITCLVIDINPEANPALQPDMANCKCLIS